MFLMYHNCNKILRKKSKKKYMWLDSKFKAGNNEKYKVDGI